MKGWGSQDDFQEQIKATIDDGVAASRSQLAGPGSKECVDCGNEIPQNRRLALPSAIRCIRCQTQHEL